MMPILRELKTVTHQQLTINLPDYWEAQEVEVIVIPRSSTVPTDSEAWKSDFLAVSQWQITEEEVRIKSWPHQDCQSFPLRTGSPRPSLRFHHYRNLTVVITGQLNQINLTGLRDLSGLVQYL